MKSFYAGTVIKLFLFVAVMATIINDGGSIVAAQYMLGERVEKIADAAGNNFKVSGSRAEAQREAQLTADAAGMVITSFQITRDKVLNLSVESPNAKTWVAHRIEALRPYLSPRTDYSRPIQ